MNDKQKEDAINRLAFDVALEIVLGCDRFDRQDLRIFLEQEGADSAMDLENMKKQTEKYVKKEFPDDSPDDWLKEELEYWYEPWK